MKVEYMLRFFNAKNLKSTFPFVPLSNLRDLMTQQAKMSWKDPKKYNKLFNHLTDLAEATLNQPNMSEIKKHDWLGEGVASQTQLMDYFTEVQNNTNTD